MDRLARKWATWVVLILLEKLHGLKYAEVWGWELTPMPCGLPTWGQLAQGLMLAGVPRPYRRKVMNSQLRTAYREMDRACMRTRT